MYAGFNGYVRKQSHFDHQTGLECCCQHGVVKDRSKAGTANAEERTIPAANRVGEGQSDNGAMHEVLDGATFVSAAKWARA